MVEYNCVVALHLISAITTATLAFAAPSGDTHIFAHFLAPSLPAVMAALPVRQVGQRGWRPLYRLLY